jgi:hypothetical protein
MTEPIRRQVPFSVSDARAVLRRKGAGQDEGRGGNRVLPAQVHQVKYRLIPGLPRCLTGVLISARPGGHLPRRAGPALQRDPRPRRQRCAGWTAVRRAQDLCLLLAC